MAEISIDEATRLAMESRQLRGGHRLPLEIRPPGPESGGGAPVNQEVNEKPSRSHIAARVFTGVDVPPAVTAFFRGLAAAAIAGACNGAINYFGLHPGVFGDITLQMGLTWMIRQAEGVILDELLQGNPDPTLGSDSGPPLPPDSLPHAY